MVKLANTLDLGSSGAILAGSSPVTCTKKTNKFITRLSFYFYDNFLVCSGKMNYTKIILWNLIGEL